MGNDVFANGREVSCKAADGKAIAAFPDVCMTPPENPATPPGVPVPYPNTAMAKDTTAGSKSVKISNKEVMLKNKSHFKKSSGDEAGSAAKKGVLTSVNRGKAYFTSWSMDVKVEGKNVVRHLDMTTHNHGSMPSNSAPWLYKDAAATDPGDCAHDVDAIDTECSSINDKSRACCDARRCLLAPKGSQPDCCDGKTKHHVIPDHCYKDEGKAGKYYKGCEKMTYDNGLCICVTGKNKKPVRKQHGRIHKKFDDIEAQQSNNVWTYGEARKAAVETCSEVADCDEDCMDQQIKQYNKQKFGIKNDKVKLRAGPQGQSRGLPRSKMGTNAV